MIDRLTPAQRRAMALVLAALVVALFYLVLLDPLLKKYRYYDDKIGELNYRLNQYHTLAKDRVANQRLLDQMKRRDLTRAYYLAKQKPALASAELQQRVKQVIDGNQAELISTQAVGAQRGEQSTDVTVRVRLRGDIVATQKVLYTLETSRPIVFLDNVVIQSGSVRRRPGPGSQTDRRPLTISFDVNGHTRKQGK